jgi:hypothetical protein
LVYSLAIWYISWPFGIFLGHLVYFLAIWWFSGYLVYIFSAVLVSCVKDNLATMFGRL